MPLVYDVVGLLVITGGAYFLWRGVISLEAGIVISGLLTLAAGLIIFRSGLELMKVGAAARVVGRAETSVEPASPRPGARRQHAE
jgi:hypothetical protein